MEDIIEADYAHANRVYKDFAKKNNLGDYHDLYVQRKASLVADVFQNFRTNVLKYTNLIIQNFFQLLN